MKKKKLKKQIKRLQHDVDALAHEMTRVSTDIKVHERCCENHKPKTVTFKRFVPLPQINSIHEVYTGEIPPQKLKETEV